MYLPDVFNIQDEQKMFEIIETSSFADLVTFNNGVLLSNKIPFFLDRDKKTLHGHLGNNNAQLHDLEQASELLVIFSGPNAYLSPLWYKTGNLVPTWNFQTVQIRGKATLVDTATLRESLVKLSQFHESQLATQWSMKNVQPEKLTAMLNAITGFKIHITDMLCKEKMSQNRSINDQESVISALQQQDSPMAHSVAAIMSKNLGES